MSDVITEQLKALNKVAKRLKGLQRSRLVTERRLQKLDEKIAELTPSGEGFVFQEPKPKASKRSRKK